MLQTQRVHLFPFRTQKLSSAVVKILYGRLYGKIAQCRHGEGKQKLPLIEKKVKKANPYGGVAQLGEHLPCKQGVMGSNPIISTNNRQPGELRLLKKADSKGNRYRANFRWTFATEEDRARSSRENRIPSSPPEAKASKPSETKITY